MILFAGRINILGVPATPAFYPVTFKLEAPSIQNMRLIWGESENDKRVKFPEF